MIFDILKTMMNCNFSNIVYDFLFDFTKIALDFDFENKKTIINSCCFLWNSNNIWNNLSKICCDFHIRFYDFAFDFWDAILWFSFVKYDFVLDFQIFA